MKTKSFNWNLALATLAVAALIVSVSVIPSFASADDGHGDSENRSIWSILFPSDGRPSKVREALLGQVNSSSGSADTAENAETDAADESPSDQGTTTQTNDDTDEDFDDDSVTTQDNESLDDDSDNDSDDDDKDNFLRDRVRRDIEVRNRDNSGPGNAGEGSFIDTIRTRTRSIFESRSDDEDGETRTRDEVRQRVEDRAGEREERREERRGELQERAKERINAYVERIIRRLNAAVERLEKITEKTESRMDKLEERFGDRGLDLSNARALLDTAKGKIGDARLAVGSVLSRIEDVLDSDEPRTSFEAIRAVIQDAKESLKEARDALVAAIREVKVALGTIGENTGSGNNDSDDDDSDDDDSDDDDSDDDSDDSTNQ